MTYGHDVSASSEFPAEHHEPHRRPGLPPDHLDALRQDPSLASLSRQGWQLDRLPTTSVAWAFSAALLTTILSFGTIATAPVLVAAVIGVMLAGSAVMLADLPAARVTLHATRGALWAWALLASCYLH